MKERDENIPDLATQMRDLRAQNKEFERSGYEGHNRRSGIRTMHGYALQRLRRIWNWRMRESRDRYNIDQREEQQNQSNDINTD